MELASINRRVLYRQTGYLNPDFPTFMNSPYLLVFMPQCCIDRFAKIQNVGMDSGESFLWGEGLNLFEWDTCLNCPTVPIKPMFLVQRGRELQLGPLGECKICRPLVFIQN